MFPFALLALGLLALFAAYGVARHLDARVRKHGPHALAWRWISGEAWHGKPITDRGFTRPGRKALTPTGHAHRRYYWPRWQHCAWRAQWTLAPLLAALGLVLHREQAAAYLAVTAAAGTASGGNRAWRRACNVAHRRAYVKPLHVRVSGLAGIPLAVKPESWLDIPRDRSYAKLTWPKNAPLPAPKDRDAIADAAAATLGMTDAKKTWQFTGPRLRLMLTPPVPAPIWVYLDRIVWGPRTPAHVRCAQDAILKAIREAGIDELVLGIGQDGKVIKVSTKLDAPHMCLSVDTGGGKSVLVRCLVPQVLMRGGIVAICDNKLVSHPSLRALPNVAYADDIDKIHDFLVWLDGELDRRARYVREHTDVEGVLHGSPGPELFVILEEQNLLMNRLRSYWAKRLPEDKALPKEQRENLPPVSPAVTGFENASYVGRELGVHLVFIAQRFTAEAAGGGSKGASVRMNAGLRLLAGWDDDTWKMLVGKGIPMPTPSRHKGRMQVYVKGAGLTEVQIAFFTHRQARQMALAGGGQLPAKLRHLSVFTGAAVTDPQPSRIIVAGAPGAGGDGAAVVLPPEIEPPAAVANWMTIAQAKEQGLLPHTWRNPSGAFGTLKNRAKRAGRQVPEVKGMQGTRAMYDAAELADFLERETAGNR